MKYKDNNPGKYDDLCTYVREQAQAEGVIVIIINGNKGAGFSVQATKRVIEALPQTLEIIARQMRTES